MRCTLSLALLALCTVALASVTVDINTGTVAGTSSDRGVQFQGIPYAAPPVGALRFMPPQPAAPWDGVFNATAPGAGCPQRCRLPPDTCPETYSEDCLTLDVFAPWNAAEMPVMVFLPGGRFQQGAAGTPVYYADIMANFTQTIVVVVNYRLGALGWLVNTPAGIPGNLGLRDQTLALQWVQQNIGAFGGDPSQVTLFGQSAGGGSVSAHLVSPFSKGLFNKVIIQSPTIGLAALTNETGDQTGALYAAALGCGVSDLSCFQAADLNSIIEAEYDKSVGSHIFLQHPLSVFLVWNVNADGYYVPGNQLDMIHSGQFNQIPVMIGNVAQEAVIFIYEAVNQPLKVDDYIGIVTVIFGADAFGVLERFPPNATDSRQAMILLGTAYIFICPTRYASRAISATVEDTYVYRFDEIWSFAVAAWGPNFTFCDDAVCHSAELPFVFHAPRPGWLYDFSPAEEILATETMSYWGNFAYSGNPNSGKNDVGLEFPQFTTEDDQILRLALPNNNIVTGLLSETCDYFDKIGYHHGEGLAKEMGRRR